MVTGIRLPVVGYFLCHDVVTLLPQFLDPSGKTEDPHHPQGIQGSDGITCFHVTENHLSLGEGSTALPDYFFSSLSQSLRASAMALDNTS
jgi:hypothetical protein